MLHNTKFQVIQKYAFNSLSSLLNDLYLPIVGYEAIHVYQALLCESSKQIAILGLPSDINEYLKIVNMDLISFFKVRQLLEAVGLLTTYLQNDSTTKMGTYYFQIHEPLNFNDFIANQKYRHLLIRSIGQVNYERLEHLYTAKHIPSSA
jgi:replication initiation and membrane attachment protein DnaB